MPPNGGTVRSGRSTRGGCLPVIRCLAGASPGAKPRCDIDFAVFYLFACAAGSPGKKGDATKSGRPRGFAPSLIMLRSRPRLPPSALFTASLARESLESGSVSLKLRLQREHCASPSDGAPETFKLQTLNFKLRPNPSASKAGGLAASSQLGKYSRPLGGVLFLGDQPLDEVLVEPPEPRGNTGNSFGVVRYKL